MDPLDLLYSPKLDAVGVQSRAKEIVQRILFFEFNNSVTEHCVRPGARAWHVVQGGPKVQETLFPGGDYKGEQPLFIYGAPPQTPPGDSIPWTSFIALDWMPLAFNLGLKKSFKEYYSLNLIIV
jgi:hypothetical protein